MRIPTGRGVLIAALLLAAPATGQEEAAPARASEVLRAMTDQLASAEHLRFHAEIDYDVLTRWGGKALLSGAADVVVSRPGSVRVDFRDDVSQRRFWLDGETATLLDPATGFYATRAAQGDIDATLDALEERHSLTLPLGQLVSNDPYTELTDDVEAAYYLGIHDADGVPAHHIALVEEEVDWQIWVEVGEHALPRKLVVTYKKLPGEPQFVAALMDWKLGEEAAANTFRAELPGEAVEIDFMERREGTR